MSQTVWLCLLCVSKRQPTYSLLHRFADEQNSPNRNPVVRDCHHLMIWLTVEISFSFFFFTIFTTLSIVSHFIKGSSASRGSSSRGRGRGHSNGEHDFYHCALTVTRFYLNRVLIFHCITDFYWCTGLWIHQLWYISYNICCFQLIKQKKQRISPLSNIQYLVWFAYFQ